VDHLYPGDGLEAAAMLLCHSGRGKVGFRCMVSDIIAIPVDECGRRTKTFLSWPFAEHLPPDKIEEIDGTGLSIFTIHSHPSGFERFSATDDRNDRELFRSVCNWFDDGRPNGSAIMLPDGKIICRTVDAQGKFSPAERVAVVGESIRIWGKRPRRRKAADHGHKVAQSFGQGTYDILRSMRIAVVGCSGTGSIITELLARTSVGVLVLVDPDVMEEKNLNRVVNSTKADAKKSVPKAEIMRRSANRLGMGTKIDTYVADTASPDVIEALIDCDVVFGCVDSAAGRYHLDCLASAFYMPYFDVGVHLDADGKGGIACADVVSHYVYPETPSLMSRGSYTSQQIAAENWRTSSPEHYGRWREEGYLPSAEVDRPAVMSINMQAACLAFNDFLARIHDYRLDGNSEFDTQTFQLKQGCYLNRPAPEADDLLFKKYAGMGDRSHLVASLRKRSLGRQ